MQRHTITVIDVNQPKKGFWMRLYAPGGGWKGYNTYEQQCSLWIETTSPTVNAIIQFHSREDEQNGVKWQQNPQLTVPDVRDGDTIVVHSISHHFVAHKNQQPPGKITVIDTTQQGIWFRLFPSPSSGGGWQGLDFYSGRATMYHKSGKDGEPYILRSQLYNSSCPKDVWKPTIEVSGLRSGAVVEILDSLAGTFTVVQPPHEEADEAAASAGEGGGMGSAQASAAEIVPQRIQLLAKHGHPHEHGRPIFYDHDPTQLILAELALNNNKQWNDADFPAGPAAWYWLVDEECGLDYKTSYESNHVQWIPSASALPGATLIDSRRHPPEDFALQQRVGDCWLLSIINVLAHRLGRARIARALFVNPAVTLPHGFVVLKLLWDGERTVYLPIDDKLPFATDPATGGKPLRPVGASCSFFRSKDLPQFSSGSDVIELAPMFIEKAFAKIANSYNGLRGGLQNVNTPIGSLRAMRALTRAAHSDERAWPTRTNTHATTELWALIKKITASDLVSTCGSAVNEDGIVSGHCYSLLSSHEVTLPEPLSDEQMRAADDAARTTVSERHDITFVDESGGGGVWFRVYYPGGGGGWTGIDFRGKTYVYKNAGKINATDKCTVRMQRYNDSDAESGAAWSPVHVVENVVAGDVIVVSSWSGGGVCKKRATEIDAAVMNPHAPGTQLMRNVQPGAKLRFVRIRNPTGGSEFTGAWSDVSLLHRRYPAVKQEIGHTADMSSKDGAFLMLFEDFTYYFGWVAWCGPIPDARSIFSRYAGNEAGELNRKAAVEALSHLFPGQTKADLVERLQELDANADGKLSLEEFARAASDFY